MSADFFSCGSRLAGEFFDLVGDDGEATSSLACGCRFDRGIEGEEIRLVRNAVDELDDLSDLGGGLVKFDHDVSRTAGLHVRLLGDFRFLGAVAGNFLDRGRHLLHCVGNAGGGVADILGRRCHILGVHGEFLGC